MGADNFENEVWGKTAEEAFAKVVERAEWNYGHAGYTGTIAEKTSFIITITSRKRTA